MTPFTGRRLRFAAALSALLLGACVSRPALGAPAPGAPGATLMGVRYWTGPDHTRIVLDVSTPVTFTQQSAGPRTLVVHLDGVSAAGDARRALRIADGVVRDVAVDSTATGIEVAVSLEVDAECRVFPIAPQGEKPDRLVIDVARAAEPTLEPAAPRPPERRERRIVIDPGHGGEDFGARGFGRTIEKAITLDIAKRVARLVDGPNDREVAVLTRERDEFVPLGRRVRVARDARADLFVSIHANSSPDPSGHGVEVFFVSLSGATDVAAQELADKENAADLIEGSADAGEAVLASDDLLGILLDMTQSETIERSSRLAESVIEAIRRRARVPVRGVKQAEFRVLRSVVVPSILIEVGFVTNREEAKKLSSSAHRERIAEGIADGIERFLELEETAPSLVDHVVAEGETLSGLAERHRMSSEELARLNGIPVGPLRIGQTIKVPR
jgi:N-acetylmuramoyl-L-alanine amidase